MPHMSQDCKGKDAESIHKGNTESGDSLTTGDVFSHSFDYSSFEFIILEISVSIDLSNTGFDNRVC